MTNDLLTSFSNQLADAVSAAAPSIVQVQGRRRPASGLVYGDNVVLTTVRALGREDGLHVRRHDGVTLDAELAGWDPTTSLAVMRVAGLDTPPIAPAQSPARVGHLALAVARSWSNAVTASAGLVSVIGGPLPTGRRRAIDEVIRTTAPMHDGFAGGAFLDTSGALIGIATAAAIRGLGVVIPAAIAWKTAATVLEHGSLKRGYLGIAGQPVALPENQRGADGREHALIGIATAAAIRGLGVVIPAAIAWKTAATVLEHGSLKRGYLGIAGQAVALPENQRGPDGRENALLVVGVTAGSPAASGGVLVGDVLLDFDGHAVDSPEDLLDLLAGDRVGQPVTLRMRRGTAVTQVTVTVGERPH